MDIIARRGKPGIIVSLNGTELTSISILAWRDATRIEWHYIAPGTFMQNGYVDSITWRMHDELLNERLFFGPAKAHQAIRSWVADSNNFHPHSAPEYRTPAAFAACLNATDKRTAPLDSSVFRPVARPALNGRINRRAFIAAGL